MLSCFVRSAIGVNVSGNAATRKSKSFKGSNVLGYFLSKFSLENCDRQITLGQMREHAFTFNTGINVYLLFLTPTRKQCGRVVSVWDSQSRGPGFESRSDHYLDLFLSSPEFKSSATLVNSQLVCLRPVRILNNVMFNLKYLLQLFARPH